MAELPDKTSLTDPAVTQAGFRAALDQLNDYLAGLLDTAGTAAAARDKLGLKDGATTTVKAIRDGLLEPGTRAVFYQAAAPLGWTQVPEVNDRVLRVVSGPGGGVGGGWTITGLSADVSVAGHALSVAQLPANVIGDFRLVGASSGERIRGTLNTDALPMARAPSAGTGGGQSHAHGASASVSHNGSWRPSYIDVIVCERAAA